MAPISSQMTETLNLPLAFQLLNNGCVFANNFVCAAQLKICCHENDKTCHFEVIL